MDDSIVELDEIDRELLRLLSENPREPYKHLSQKLEEQGHEMSGEGIRYRVSKLLDATSTFFLLAPAEHNWEIVRIGIELNDEEEAFAEAFEQVSETGIWLICRGFGAFDIWAVGTAQNNEAIRDLLSEVRSLEHVETVHHFVETDRENFMHDYLALD